MKDTLSLPPTLDRFEAALHAEGFRGDIRRDWATRAVMATDNSVYELAPQAVVFPREPDDLNRILRASAQSGMAVTARGGGTGTNGQSLTDAVVVDCSRHLRRIEHIDPEAGIAVVQPGVILDELNRAAAPHGLFFAPTVSTASRATLGGMAATDASGKGSRHYGRTSDHVLAMDVALADGCDWRAEPLAPAALASVCARDDRAGQIHRRLRDIALQDTAEIDRVFPAMNRGLTGYNLKQLYDDQGRFRLTKLLCGSEGSLAMTKRLTLRLTRKKPLSALLVVGYDDVLAALRDVGRLIAADPSAIEFIDDRIVELAQQDPIWGDIAGVLSPPPGVTVRGLNFVEVQAETAAELDAAIARLTALAARTPASVVSAVSVRDPRVIGQLWSLRSKCVGLLGRMDPERQGTAFVEDAAVPPEALADFVAGFRDILDSRGLAYGMFGHADVGCLHVRPALDMRRPGDAAHIRPVSDAVAALARRHGGLLWGEHGKGLRGEYGPDVFGPDLYARMCDLKRLFDPENRLNPGKIASPAAELPLKRIDGVPFRGPLDAAIPAPRLQGFEKAVKCNGNGQCFNRSETEAMCPSYKASGDRLQSPKGRATLLRQWLRPGPDKAGIEAALAESLSTCLACKACATQCPVQVDIPAMRSKFLAEYFQTRSRPLRHHLLAMTETLAPLMRALPRLANAGLVLGAPVLRRLGLVDLPRIAPARRRRRISGPDQGPGVLLLEDSFNATWDGVVIEAAEQLLGQLGYRVERVTAQANGKALHVLGMLDRFDRVCRRALDREAELVATGLPIVTLEPAVLALMRDEYRASRLGPSPVQSLEGFLCAEIDAGRLAPRARTGARYALFNHCTGKSSDPQSDAQWQKLFRHLGADLAVEATGCCGMAGAFGHELANARMSRDLYEMTWAPKLAAHAAGTALATGFSCRCQAERFSDLRLPHPAEVLAGQAQP